MKKFVITMVVCAVAVIGLLIPATASATPGRSCNPAPGHGNSGCHRVSGTATPKAKKKVTVRKAKRKRASHPATKPATKRAVVATPTPAPVATPTPAPVVPTKAISRPRVERAPLPWWMELWDWLTR